MFDDDDDANMSVGSADGGENAQGMNDGEGGAGGEGGEMDIISTQFGENGEAQTTQLAERTTTKFLTKYERARVLGTRALQISMVSES